MIIRAKYDKATKNWKVDEDTCQYYPVLRSVLNTYGTKAIAYISMVADPDSPFAWCEDKVERASEVFESVFTNEKVDYIPKLKEAIIKYEKMCDTLENKLRNSYRGGAEKLMKYVDGERKITGENIKDVLSAMKEYPNLITTVTELKKQIDTDNKQNVGRIKSNRELSYAEKKARG